jgi:hypothetical protein
MKLRSVGIYSILLAALAAFSMGCEPYHHGRVGVSLDIHSKDYHKDDGDRHDDHHDDHHDKDDHHDDNR